MPVLKLDNPIQSYAWGSHTAIADLLGRSPSAEPEAELWMGAHPKAPSKVEIGGRSWPLHEAIARDPEELLGIRVVESFGPQLPFLLKVLAAGQPLSIQAHPDLAQAAEGFAREEAEGLSRDQRERNYRDRNHKPEILYALTPFTALRGFLPIERVWERLLRVGLGPLLPSPVESLDPRDVLDFYLHLQGPGLERAHRLVFERRRLLDATSAAWIERLEEYYPGDRGVMAPVFLRIVELQPGEALFTGPGILHAYLDGVGVELMASSDNVLRCALTQKHVDAEELLHIARFDGGSGRIEPRVVDGARIFETPADELRLAVIEISTDRSYWVRREPAGAEILLCSSGQGRLVSVEGECQVDGHAEDEGPAVEFSKGDAFFVPGDCGDYRLEGEATVFLAGVARCP